MSISQRNPSRFSFLENARTRSVQFFQFEIHADVGLGVTPGAVGLRLLHAEDLGQILQFHVSRR